MPFTRRFFLKSGGIAVVGIGAGLTDLPGFLVRAAEGGPARRKTLVVVFQRGAADGLNMVVPFGEKAYYELRPTIAIPRPKRGKEGTALDLDGSFGLHPTLEPFRRLYADRQLAVVHAAGSPSSTRSHFDAQDFMESGTPGVKSTEDGWLNRYLQTHRCADCTSFRAVSATSQLPRILGGSAPALAVPDVSDFGIRGGRAGGLIEQGLRELYRDSGDALFQPTAQETFEAMELLARLDPARYAPEHGARYPRGGFGRTMLQIAQLIKAGAGLEIAFAEIGGWDHHVNEGSAEGPLANLLREFSGAIGAFAQDLGDRMEDVVLVTLSEFGRTARENGNRGTDHGHANTMFVLGGPVRGGKLYGEFPGLAREQLFEGRDLALTSDYRDVMAELLVRHLGAGDLSRIFPGHDADASRFRGLLA